jgi:hypothetical protein
MHAWHTYSLSWPFLKKHLFNSSYFLSFAMWNEDGLATDRYCDMLVRWIDGLNLDQNAQYWIQKTELITPDLLSERWALAETRMSCLKRHQYASCPLPDGAFGLAVRNTHSDVLTITAAIALEWSVADQRATDISASTVRALLQRQTLKDAGSRVIAPCQPPDIYMTVWALIVKSSLA